jgi:Mn2+/Fe2+ NRAMP family transporter
VQVVLGLEAGGEVVMALLAGVLLMLDLRRLARALGVLVGVMSLFFVATMVLAPVDWPAALRGLVVPEVPAGSLVTVVALLGTTIVTYNLFLHASAARAYWAGTPTQRAWRGELAGMAIFLPIGGLISFAILVAGATLEGAAVERVSALAVLLEPAAGRAARYLFGLGLFAAGITSAVTAPLAAAAGISELFGWEHGSRRYRAVWASVLVVGLFFSLAGLSPLRVIIAAQAANGVLLPFMAAFVLYLTYRQQAVRLPGWYLAAGALVTLVCAGFGARTLWWVWSQLT